MKNLIILTIILVCFTANEGLSQKKNTLQKENVDKNSENGIALTDTLKMEFVTQIIQNERCDSGFKNYVVNTSLKKVYSGTVSVSWTSSFEMHSLKIPFTLKPGEKYFLGCDRLNRPPYKLKYQVIEEREETF